MSKLAQRLEELAKLWDRQAATYPDTNEGRHIAWAWREAAKELRAELFAQTEIRDLGGVTPDWNEAD